MRLSTVWQKEQLLKMDQSTILDDLGRKLIYEKIVTDSLSKKWIIYHLIDKNIPYKLYNMGGGVTKITTDTTVCTKCKGLGHI